ncbi:MAG: dTDP-4-dehydrorhamnose 3,5-epimerase [Flavobacteriia bacterium]|nr:dTDP-4-dehydrorhamnose 3,5-epimerase [Flavobacteriia bacterium]
MEIIKCDIEGLLIIKPRVFVDNRGSFFESFNVLKFQEITGLNLNFCQDNESISHINVLRGLHFQNPPFSQGKLVRVVQGKAMDVAVDIRKSSPTYGKYQMIELSSENKLMFWIPPGFAHGFLSLEENTIFNYKCTNYYNPNSERCIKWNDENLNINWPLATPFVSEKDEIGQDFVTFVSQFD